MTSVEQAATGPMAAGPNGLAAPSIDKPNVWVSFYRTLLRFQRDKVTPWLAFRNTLGMVLPLAAGISMGQTAAGIALATGALNVSYSDSHDPYGQRARKMLASSFLVGFAVCFGTLLGRYHLAAVAMVGIWALAAGLLVAISTTAADLGVISLVTLVIYSALPQPPDRAVYAGLLALAGGLFQMLFALVLWPLRRFAPERRALGELFLELARLAAEPVRATKAPPGSAASTRAQQALASVARSRSLEAERYRLLLSQAERIRLSLLTLGRVRIRLERERPDGLESAILDRFVATCSRILLPIGNALVAGQSVQVDVHVLQDLAGLADSVRGWNPPGGTQVAALVADAGRHMEALGGQLRAVTDLSASTSSAGLDAFQRREQARPWKLRLAGTFVTLRANLTLQSAAFRHAIRLAVCVAAGDALSRAMGLHRPYWMPMTIAIVLKPDFTATFSRGALRLIGTFTGLALTTALFHWLQPSMAGEVAMLAAFMFLLRCYGGANYGLFVTAITALVAMLFALGGVSPKEVVAWRALNTLLGGVIAVLAYSLWPTWERNNLPEVLALMLEAYRDYFHSIREGYECPDKVNPGDLDQSRLTARLARSNVEASMERLTNEPGTSQATLIALSGMLASSHRLVHSMMALESGLSTSGPVPARRAFRPFANDVESTFTALVSALRGTSLTIDDLPDLRKAQRALVHSGEGGATRYALVNVETDRVTNSLNTVSEELLGWLASRKR